RVAPPAGGRAEGCDGRDEFLAHVDRMVVGRDTRLGARVGWAWIVAALGLALDLPAGDTAQVDGDGLIVHRGHAVLTAYAIGSPWAHELADKLDERASVDSVLGHVTVGLAPAHDRGDDKPL